METNRYVSQWKEVKEMTAGKTMDEIRSVFGKDVTNDFREGDEEIIDANYKDILVTFVDARLHNCIEAYDRNGVFLDVIDVSRYV